METQLPLKIIELRAKNVLNLKAVQIKPDGDVIVLTGKNGAGKSAILDSIMFALTGKTPEMLIRDGAEKGEVEINLGRFIVKKVWTKKIPRLEIYTPDKSAKFSSPQTLLNEVIGELSFDPLAFKNMDAKKQRDLIAELVGIDMSDIESKKAVLYENRKNINRDIKGVEASLAGIPTFEESLPGEEISISKTLSHIQAMEEAQKRYKNYLIFKGDFIHSIEQCDRDILDYKEQIAELQDRIKQKQAYKAGVEKQLSELKEPANVTDDEINAIKNELSGVEEKNKKIRLKITKNRLSENLTKLKTESEAITKQLEDIEAQKIQKIKACKFPVDSMSIDEDKVLIGNVPFSQMSTGQQIKISTAMAMALNPKIKIIMIRDGSLLDKSGMESIVDMAKTGAYQIWIEKVDEGGKMGIFIEDGSITAINGEAVKEEPVKNDEV